MKLNKIIKLAKRNNTYDRVYGDFVHKKIRGSYNESNELALLRKEVALLKAEVAALKGELIKQTEFDEYNTYVEQCKAEVKKELGLWEICL